MVEAMGLDWINAWFTKLTFQQVLLERAAPDAIETGGAGTFQALRYSHGCHRHGDRIEALA
ncbi:MAG: hypothetical protein U0559_00385 [Anaerolineae bacterium]